MARKDLTNGPVWRALAAVSAPMSLGILAVLSVGIADAYFLGQLGGEPLAAVGYIYPVTTALSSLAIGLSAGANSAVSQAIGRGDGSKSISRLSLHAVALGLVLALAVAGLFVLAASPLFTLMGASEAVRTEIAAYTPIWALSFPFLVLLMVINALFRAHGDAITASLAMITAAAVNIALNPILIFGWGPIEGFGTAGAATATLIGRVFAAFGVVVFAIYAGYLRKCGSLLAGLQNSIRTVTEVGAPAAFSNAINPAGMALVTAAVATLGDAAVAGFGAATRIQSLAIVAMLALSAGIGPVVGQNWGANKQDRAQTALLQSWFFCLAYGTGLALVFFFFADAFAQTIASDEEAAGYARQYLLIVGCTLFGYGILVTANAAMNARSKAVYSMGLSLGRIFAIYLPLAWLGVLAFGYSGVLLAAATANIAAVAGSIWCCRQTKLLPTRLSSVLEVTSN